MMLQLKRVVVAAVVALFAAGVFAPGVALAAPAVQTTVTYEDVPVGEVRGTPQVSYGTSRVVPVSEQVVARDARVEKISGGRVVVTPVQVYAVDKVREVPVTTRTPYYQVYDRFRITREYRPGYWDTRTVTETQYRQVQETVFQGYRTEYYQEPVTRYETRYREVQVPYTYVEYVPVTRTYYELRYRTETLYRIETRYEPITYTLVEYYFEWVPVAWVYWGPVYQWVPRQRLVTYTMWVPVPVMVPYEVQVAYLEPVTYTELVPETKTGYRTVLEAYEVPVVVYETRSRQVPVYETVTRLEPYEVTRTESYWVSEWSQTTRDKVGSWTAAVPHRWEESVFVQRTCFSETESREGAPATYRSVVALTR